MSAANGGDIIASLSSTVVPVSVPPTLPVSSPSNKQGSFSYHGVTFLVAFCVSMYLGSGVCENGIVLILK